MQKALISDLTLAPSDERQLVSFLRGYKHVADSEVCQINLKRMPHVWIRMPNGWQRIQSGLVQLPPNVSWCQWILRSALRLDRAGYEKVKKDLFSKSNAVNGVYKKGSEYALVYEPSQKLSGKEWAAIAAGSSIAVGGLLTLGMMGINKWRGPDDTLQHSAPTSNSTAPNPLSIDQIPWYHEIIQQSQLFYTKRTQHTDSPLKAQDFGIEKFKALLNAYEQAGESLLRENPTKEEVRIKQDIYQFIERFQNQITRVESLIQSQTPESEIRKLFGPLSSFKDIVTSNVWTKHRKPISEFLRVGNQNSDLYFKLQAADLFEEVYNAGTDDALKDEIVKFCTKDRGSSTNKKPFFDQAHQELVALHDSKPWAVELLRKCAEPLSRNTQSFWLLTQIVERLQHLKVALESKLGPDTIPPIPNAEEEEYDELPHDYGVYINRIKRITPDQPDYQTAQVFLADKGALINQVGRLITRSISLNLRRMTTNDALTAFTAISQRPDLKHYDLTEDPWYRNLADTFYLETKTYPVIEQAKQQLNREWEYIDIRTRIRDHKDITQAVQSADSKVIDTLLADSDIGPPYRDLIVNLRRSPGDAKEMS